MADTMTMITGAENIETARLLTLKHMLRLEMKGLKRSRSPSAYSIIKRDLGFRGNRQRVLTQLEDYINERLCT
jgi:hypothetical protein